MVMKKILSIIFGVLVLSISTSFTLGDIVVSKKILFEGKITLKGKIYDAYMQFSVNQQKGKITSLKVRAKAFWGAVSESGEIELRNLKKNDSTQLIISHSIDKHMLIYVSEDFSDQGGLITVTIKKSNGEIGFEKIYVAPFEDTFKAYQDSISAFSRINGLDILIQDDKVKEYKIKTSYSEKD